MAGRRRQRQQHAEEHENHERWLITYADTITLLMVLFIVLFAISQVDMKKFEELAAGMASSLGHFNPTSSGSVNIMPGGATSIGMGDATPIFSADAIPNIATEMTLRANGSESAAMTTAKAAVAKDNVDLDKAQRSIDAALRKAGLRDRVVFTRDHRGLTVTVVVDDLVFPADRADLQPAGKRLLEVISPVLSAAGHDVVVEGHTNTVPVKPLYYPSEWELSSARASSVARYLSAPLGLDPRRLSVAGYGDTRPLLPDTDPRSSTLNRRVAIVVLTSVTAEQRALADSDPSPSTSNDN